MSHLEDFLGKNKKNELDKTRLTRSESQYQCQECDLWSEESFFDIITSTLYWECTEGHQSKVELNVGSSGD